MLLIDLISDLRKIKNDLLNVENTNFKSKVILS